MDFVSFEAKLIVEIDGSQHLTDQAEYDSKRDDWLRSQGFMVLRFWNNEVLQELDGVMEKILQVLAWRPSP